MKKLTLFFLALLACGLAFQACDNTKTYAEMLEEEKDAIKAFIRDSSITVISQTEFYRNDSTTDSPRMNMCNSPVACICRSWTKALKIRLIR